MLDLAVISFILVFLAEFGDKSQLVTLSFTTEGNAPLTVLLGVTVGLGGVTLLGVIGGSLLYSLIPVTFIQLGVALVFFFLGTSMVFILWRERKTLQDQTIELASPSEVTPSLREVKSTGVVKIASTLFLMELGDKTQLLIIALVASTSFPLIVGVFCFLGLLTGNVLVILLGKTLSQKVSPYTIRLLSAGLFMIFGGLTFLEVFGILTP
ncbi:MAG: TMEM165/GDT1 family protein [Candidatus Ranarchaeia archaeon]